MNLRSIVPPHDSLADSRRDEMTKTLGEMFFALGHRDAAVRVDLKWELESLSEIIGLDRHVQTFRLKKKAQAFRDFHSIFQSTLRIFEFPPLLDERFNLDLLDEETESFDPVPQQLIEKHDTEVVRVSVF